MKKLLIALLFFSGHALAEDHFYAGTNLSVFGDSDVEILEYSLKNNTDVGASVFGGYSINRYTGMELGFEVEYQHVGTAKYGNVFSVESQAYYVNFRPKYVEEGNSLYSALFLGIGAMSSEFQASGENYKDTEFSYQVGFEIGYMIKQWDIGLGYRYQAADFGSNLEGLDLSRHWANISIRYRF